MKSKTLETSIWKASFKINWGLMAVFALPLSLYLFFRPFGPDDEIIYGVSYYQFLADWISHYQIDGEFWGDVGDIAMWCLGLSVFAGFFASFVAQLLVFLVRRWRIN